MMLMSVKHYAFYRFGTMDHLQPSQISALASTAKWIFSLTFETTFMRLQTILMPAHFFTCLKLSSNASLLPLYQWVPYLIKWFITGLFGGLPLYHLLAHGLL